MVRGLRPVLAVTRLAHAWDRLRTSFWFVPSAMSLAAAVVAAGLLVLDAVLPDAAIDGTWLLYLGGAEGARGLLSTVAGAIITVIGVAFSVTLVALQLASSQFGPRILRTFIRDRGTQAVLGTLVATFVYCLLVLRTVRGSDAVTDGFVPHLAVTGAVVLSIVSVAMLIYFIHHLSVSVQVDRIVSAVAQDLEDAIEALFPEELGESGQEEPAAPAAPPAGDEPVRVVSTPAGGYLQMIDIEHVVRAARDRDVVVWTDARPGDFVVPGATLARVSPRDRTDEGLEPALREHFILGDERTLVQDLAFGFQQLCDIALRALSPGMNDPFTAMACLDRAAIALARLGRRRSPSPHHRDGEGRVRVITAPLTMEEIVKQALDPIRRYARGHVTVLLHIVHVVGLVLQDSPRGDLRAALLVRLRMIEQDARDHLPRPDHVQVAECAEALRRRVGVEMRRSPTAA